MQGYKVTSNREYAQNESYTGVRGNRIAEYKGKAYALMYVVCRGNKTHK